MRVRTSLTVGALMAACFMAPSAQADWILTPYAGIVFGGDLGIEDNDDLDLEQGHSVYGLGLGYMGDSALGFEFDFGYSPDFFGTEQSIVPENNLVTAMANLVLNAPLGSNGRVYVSAGGGVLKSRVSDSSEVVDISRSDFGVNAGVGLIVPLGDRFGVRGDVRYFRNIGDPEPDDEFDLDFGSFDFWRATAGLAINF